MKEQQEIKNTNKAANNSSMVKKVLRNNSLGKKE
jgi:hypothetical protein